LDDGDKSILDAGCGAGDLHAYLKIHNPSIVEYVGVDAIPEMVEVAQKSNPSAVVRTTTIELVDGGCAWDCVVASGLFSMRLDDNVAYMDSVVRKMVSLARKKVIFNVLSADSATKDPSTFYYYGKDEVLDICKKYSSCVTAIDGYLGNDRTFFLKKNTEK
tara:strand:+ start:3182 stop:3664 length:483 start_codon:yes stop_codon:yes gene_type:complete